MQTRTYPRTMKEAFGPYTDDTLYESTHTSKSEKIAVYVGVVVMAALSVIVLVSAAVEYAK